MATRFWPGPWTEKSDVANEGIDWGEWDIVAQGRTLATVFADHDFFDAEANAHLIAAAPDLYALAVLGGRVRAAQTSYFKNRTQANLDAARALEAEYDRLAALVTAKARGEETMTQASLIGGA